MWVSRAGCGFGAEDFEHGKTILAYSRAYTLAEPSPHPLKIAQPIELGTSSIRIPEVHPAHGIASGSLPPRNSFLLSFASLFADISTEMLYPILPILLTHTRSVVGLIEGIAGATQNIVQGIFAWGVNWR